MIDISDSRLNELKNNLSGKKIAVIGDMMLDGYYWGDVKRISPEAPVPVLEVEEEFFRFGGAANVALLAVVCGNRGTADRAVGLVGPGPVWRAPRHTRKR